MKPGFWIGIDEKFLVREPDVNQLILMKDGVLNYVAEQVIKHFDQAKRGHGLIEIH
ncbi:13215_t:CDS:2 [Ambispora leptoticha]|uniref:13215_t:CDS:1 n=1 Tax=Ambispora leptoticha TaxID=144679 RepID=A0A9N9F7G5_9GLOM|nr:13215_t:CDS:2 [Ambispora leptoticha]